MEGHSCAFHLLAAAVITRDERRGLVAATAETHFQFLLATQLAARVPCQPEQELVLLGVLRVYSRPRVRMHDLPGRYVNLRGALLPALFFAGLIFC